MSSVDVLHLLEKGKEIEKGYYKMKWKLIKNGTWNLYTNRYGNGYSLGIKIGCFRTDNYRSKYFFIDSHLIWWDIYFWISWDIRASEDDIERSLEMAKTYGRFPTK